MQACQFPCARFKTEEARVTPCTRKEPAILLFARRPCLNWFLRLLSVTQLCSYSQVLAEFYANWCPHCRHYAHTYEQVSVFKLLYVLRSLILAFKWHVLFCKRRRMLDKAGRILLPCVALRAFSWPSGVWWFPSQKHRIYTVYIWFWPTLAIHVNLNQEAVPVLLVRIFVVALAPFLHKSCLHSAPPWV